MLTLKKVKELVGAPSHAKRTPSPKMLYEEGIVLLRREFDQGSHLTVYNSGYVLFSAGKRNTVFHIKQYLLATLYNAPVTVDSYYSAQVRHEFGWGSRVDKN